MEYGCSVAKTLLQVSEYGHKITEDILQGMEYGRILTAPVLQKSQLRRLNRCGVCNCIHICLIMLVYNNNLRKTCMK